MPVDLQKHNPGQISLSEPPDTGGPSERLLVCISSDPLAERLLSTARRLAGELHAEWIAVYVETPDSVHQPQEKRDSLAHFLQMAEDWGGKSLILQGSSVVEAILIYAHQHRITKIITGKSLQWQWRALWGRSTLDRLIRESGDIDIYVISGSQPTESLWNALARQFHSPWQRYLGGIALVILASVFNIFFHRLISPVNLVMVYLLADVVTAVYLGRGPSILVSILSVFTLDFFFVPPYFTLAVSNKEYVLTFLGLFVVGVVISHLTGRVRDQALIAQRREADTAALYGLTKDLSFADGIESVLKAITSNVSRTFGRDVIIFLPVAEVGAQLKPYSLGSNFNLDEKEQSVAKWVFQHGQPAGHGTETMPAAEARYLPLQTSQGVIGVLGVKPEDVHRPLNPDQRRLLESFASQAAQAIERILLADRARKTQLLQETEKLQTALLNSISHDLRTPLVSVTGIINSLREERIALNEETRQSLLETASEEADRLNRLVGNLLNMTRIEAGSMHLNLEVYDIQEVIGSALEQIANRLEDRPIMTDVPADLPLIPMDFVLIDQVLTNLFDNALKYSPPGSPIEVSAHLAGAYLEIDVMDRGVGIPDEDLKHIFDKFFRVKRAGNVSGTGLGLSICKGIVEAHQGFIGAANRPGGGTIITVALPAGGSHSEF